MAQGPIQINEQEKIVQDIDGEDTAIGNLPRRSE
jgi:hypothetical protein